MNISINLYTISEKSQTVISEIKFINVLLLTIEVPIQKWCDTVTAIRSLSSNDVSKIFCFPSLSAFKVRKRFLLIYLFLLNNYLSDAMST